MIPSEKLRDYLLSPLHPIGRYKYTFFRSLGYTPELWETLERDLRGLLDTEANPLEVTEYGKKFAVRGRLIGPSERTAGIVSVWIVLSGEAVARFVTAYPED